MNIRCRAAMAAALGVGAVLLSGCSSARTIAVPSCKDGIRTVGETSSVVLSQPQAKAVAKLGETVAVAKHSGAAKGLITKPEVDPGKAFCESSESTEDWYFVAQRRGQFTLGATFASGVGTNAAQVALGAVIEVR
jgi:hypothetical protein